MQYGPGRIRDTVSFGEKRGCRRHLLQIRFYQIVRTQSMKKGTMPFTGTRAQIRGIKRMNKDFGFRKPSCKFWNGKQMVQMTMGTHNYSKL